MNFPHHKYEGVYVGVVMALLLIVFLCLATGCASASNKPIPVSIVTPVQVTPPEKPVCWIDDPPIPPEEISTLMAEDDIVRRVFVHIRQYNELVVWAKDTLQWMTVLKTCVDQMHE